MNRSCRLALAVALLAIALPAAGQRTLGELLGAAGEPLSTTQALWLSLLPSLVVPADKLVP